MGINYYHESMGHTIRTDDQIDQDLSVMYEKFDSIKLYHNPFLPDSIMSCATIAHKAKKKGFRVIWTENDDTVVLNQTNWSDYAIAVLKDSYIARGVGVDEF